MPRGNKRKRHAPRKPKFVEPKEIYEEEYDPAQDEPAELSHYDQLLASFGSKKPRLETAYKNDDEDSSKEDEDTNDTDNINENENNKDDGDDDDDDETNKSDDDNNHHRGKNNEESDDDFHSIHSNDKIIEENSDETIQDDGDITTNKNDTYFEHFNMRLEDDVAEEFLVKPTWEKHTIENKWMDDITFYKSPISKAPDQLNIFNNMSQSLKSMPYIYKNIATCNKKFLPSEQAEVADPLTAFQENLFSTIDNYLDLNLVGSGKSDEEIKVVYCLHVLRHLLKSTKVIVKNNEKLKNGAIEEARDQGLTTGKVLIIAPMRSHAYKIITILIALLYNDKLHVTNKERFMQEFGGDDEGVKKGFKPEDYEDLFSGNNDDNFKLGVVVRQRSLKLYADFYHSDLIIASPVALKHVIAPENSSSGHHDFLSSIELLVLDCMPVLLMQNWAHVLLLLKHTNKRLVKTHGVDLSRVRLSCLNSWSKLYRQTIMISTYQSVEFMSLFNKHCTNLQGKILAQTRPQHGSIANVVSTLPQTFKRFEASNVSEADNERFNYFVNKVLPDYLNNPCSNILIFIPSYYDFIRIRNHFKKEDLSFAVVSDHTEEADVQKARQQFFLSNVKFLLFTERFHFFNRYQIKGINHLLFYSLPQNGHFYSEFCNMIGMTKRSAHPSSLAIYSKYDLYRLTAIFGARRAETLLSSDKQTHLFISSDD